MERPELKQFIARPDLLFLKIENGIMPSQLSHFLRKARKLRTGSLDPEIGSVWPNSRRSQEATD